MFYRILTFFSFFLYNKELKICHKQKFTLQKQSNIMFANKFIRLIIKTFFNEEMNHLDFATFITLA